VVVVMFENRSLDNVLGRLYGQGDGKAGLPDPDVRQP
jgi:phospholipase C